jgi:hypothetical protein
VDLKAPLLDEVNMSKAVRWLLDLRMLLIAVGFFIGVCAVAIAELFAGSVVMLEMPHIEGGTEVTVHNIMHDILEDNDGQFIFIPEEEEPEPEPERNEWGIREDMIARGSPCLR